jgi:hypothetical protein
MLTVCVPLLLTTIPPFSDKTILNFFSGRGFERQIAKECEPIVVDGIHLTIDDDLGEHGISEIKTTRRRKSGFKPDGYEWWMTRAMQYCYARKVNEMNLVVYFIIDSEIKSWKLTFDDKEIQPNWYKCKARANILRMALQEFKGGGDGRYYMKPFYVKGLLPPWQCKLCQYKPHCYYYNEEVLPPL